MSTKMDKLKAAQEKVLQKLHKAQEEEKQIRKRMAELTRNERTHRLCSRGGYLEKLLETKRMAAAKAEGTEAVESVD